MKKFRHVYNATHVTKEAQQRTSLAAAIAAIRPHIEAAERERVLREIRENDQSIRKLASDWGMEIKIEQIRSGK